jgi:Domain of unknown function (DUF1844)
LADNKNEKHNQNDDSFKVIDRRPFTSSGELRPEAIDEERREREAADNAAKAEAQRNESRAAKTEASADSKPGNNIRPSRNFQMLIDFLARNCAALLGGMADPRTGQPLLDLEGAREMIDMLDALRETTHGNLATEDDQLLVEVIGSLKLTFMDVSKAAAAAAAAPSPAIPRKL